MLDLFDTIDSDNLAGSCVIVGILFWVGKGFAECHERARQAGLYAGAAALLVYFAVSYAPNGNVASTAFRGVLIAGAVTGLVWLALPLAYVVYATTFGQLLSFVKNVAVRTKQATAQRRWEREQEADRNRRAAEELRLAPIRERELQAAEAMRVRTQFEADARNRAAKEMQQKRDKCRATCELLYRQYGPEIKDRFTKKMLDEFIETYMGDSLSADEVERRGMELQQLIRGHAAKVMPAFDPQSLDEVTTWYEKELANAKSMDDPKMREFVLLQLRSRRDNYINRILEER